MRLWRICRRPYADLAREGARLFGGRWNSPGRPVVYTAETAALAVLEVRVHLDLTVDLLPADFVLMKIETAKRTRTKSVRGSRSAAPAIATATKVTSEIEYGDEWLESLRTPLLRVPSSIVPESRNVLINPLHPDARSITVASIRLFEFDERLWLPRL